MNRRNVNYVEKGIIAKVEEVAWALVLVCVAVGFIGGVMVAEVCQWHR